MVLIHFDVLVITNGHVELVGRHCSEKKKTIDSYLLHNTVSALRNTRGIPDLPSVINFPSTLYAVISNFYTFAIPFGVA